MRNDNSKALPTANKTANVTAAQVRRVLLAVIGQARAAQVQIGAPYPDHCEGELSDFAADKTMCAALAKLANDDSATAAAAVRRISDNPRERAAYDFLLLVCDETPTVPLARRFLRVAEDAAKLWPKARASK